MIVENSQSTYANDTSVIVTDLCIPGLDDTSVIIIKDGDFFNLNYRSIVIILNIRIVVVTRIEIQIHVVGADVYINISSGVSPEIHKIELSIGEYRKFNGSFDKDIGVSVILIKGSRIRFA
jgi:hypothetical protein